MTDDPSSAARVVGVVGAAPATPGLVSRSGAALIALQLLVLVLVLAAAPAAHAHGDAGSTNYESRVDAIDPADADIQAEVRAGDDRIRITNLGDEELLVLGYQGEPYVRIGPDGVFVNHSSAAYHTNQDRYGEVEVPDDVDALPPQWVREKDSAPRYEFHDHRIHWMLRSLPPTVDPDERGRQLVNRWRIPIRVGDVDGEIRGTLSYTADRPWWTRGGVQASGGAAVLVLGGLAAVLARRRRTAADRGGGDGEHA